jgi:tRNA 2-thiocytidine biosynthesis protein TtcA
MADPRKQAFEENKLDKKLSRLVGQAISDFGMIADGDKVMVCVSGGKDSYTLLDILLKLRERAPISFEIVAVNLDQKQPNFPAEILPNYLEQLNIAFHIEEQDTYSIVKRVIPEALGHHRDDILETLLLNMFFAGKLKGMPPKLRSDDGRHIVIRPLAYVPEKLIERYATMMNFPIIPCDLCGSQPNLQRAMMKKLLRDWEKQFPGRVENIFRAMHHIVPSHLMDPNAFNFQDLEIHEDLSELGMNLEGDLAIDEGEDICALTEQTQFPISFSKKP